MTEVREEVIVYGPIIELLCERITEKHKQYGTSYLGRDFKWLHKRMMGEVDELSAEMFSPHLSGDGIIKECLDVAICALLIADKKRREEDSTDSTITIHTFEDPAPF